MFESLFLRTLKMELLPIVQTFSQIALLVLRDDPPSHCELRSKLIYNF